MDLRKACAALFPIGDGLLQCSGCFDSSDGGGDYPETELIILQTSLKIRNQYFQQILFSFVKMTEMSAPRHIADRTYSGLSQVWVVWSAGHNRLLVGSHCYLRCANML